MREEEEVVCEGADEGEGEEGEDGEAEEGEEAALDVGG